jgi:hypothetical protein
LDDENTIIPVDFISREEFLEKALFHPKEEKVDLILLYFLVMPMMSQLKN